MSNFLNKLFKNFFKRKTKNAPPKKIGRNEPCWCGSGLKYKRCHWESDQNNKKYPHTKGESISPRHKNMLGIK